MKKHAQLLIFVALASCAQLAPREDFDALQAAVDADAVLADVDAELGADVAADAQDGDAAADGEVDVKDVAVPDADGAEVVLADAYADVDASDADGADATDAGGDTPDSDAAADVDGGVDAKPDVPPDVVVDACAGKNCDDSVPCTTDSCVPATGCTFTPDNSKCDDSNPCTADSCTTATGCTNTNINGSCSDGSACTTGDTCQGGTCTGSAISCADAYPCTTDSCNSSTGCVHTAVNSACDDGIACTTDACSTISGCSHTPVNSACDDSTTCTTDTCSVSTGCVHVSDGTTCNDGNVCTSDVCTSGNGATGCSHSNVGGTCDDGNACTTGDTCTAGVCAGTGPVCGDSQCTCGETTASCPADCTSAAPAGMVLIPAGTFWMGCNATKDTGCGTNEKPQHKVTLSAYYMDLTETTVTQYKACVDASVCTVPSAVQPTQYATYPGLTTNPVNNVSWTQSQQYCKWRGAAFDLPTEAQWEMAAKGSCEKNGSTAGDAGCAAAMRTYPWGGATATCSYAVMYDGAKSGCGTNATWAVGSKTAGDSPYGLHDMAGNVYEWTRDWYSSTYYGSSPATDPYDSASASSRVYRGGGFSFAAVSLRAGYRGYDPPSSASYALGLRCMRSYP